MHTRHRNENILIKKKTKGTREFPVADKRASANDQISSHQHPANRRVDIGSSINKKLLGRLKVVICKGG